MLEFEEKLERIARFLAAENLGGALLNAQHNFAWLTCGGRNGVDESRDPGVGTLLVRRDGRRFVLASRIEMARLLAEELNGQEWEPIEFGWAEEKASPAFIADRAKKTGVTGATLYNVAARAYAEEGFPGEEQLHHQGGAIGYRTREWVAHPHNAEQVQPPQAFAWNPSITGTKVEETVIAFDGHCEVITASPGWPSLSVEVEGVRYELPGVLTL